jgi:hypothetical protein
VPVRVSPTDRIRHHIDELFADGRPLPEILEEVARLGAQLLMQAALEAEVTEFLGRNRYQRAAACENARARVPQRVPGGDGQDHRRAGGPGPAQAARHHRGVRLPAVRQPRHQDPTRWRAW